MARGIGDTHKHYTSMINFRENWRGYLWQGRFRSFPLDEKYLYAAMRYVERNPVRAGIVNRAEGYAFSSARAHVAKTKDPVLSGNFFVDRVKDWQAFLADGDDEADKKLFRKHARVGRPLGQEGFIEKAESITGRILKLKKRGRKEKGVCPQIKENG